MTQRRASDHDRSADFRTGQDRRSSDRRAPRRPFDPGFAAILVNQISPAEAEYVAGYPAEAPAIRSGLVVNFQA